MIRIDERHEQVEELLTHMGDKRDLFTEEEREVLTKMFMDVWRAGWAVGHQEAMNELEDALGPLVELLGWDVWSNKE